MAAKAKDKYMIDNSDGFLDGLPAGPLKKRFGSIFKASEEVLLKEKLLLYEKRLKTSKRRLRKLEQEKDSDDEGFASAVIESSDDSGSQVSGGTQVTSPKKGSYEVPDKDLGPNDDGLTS